MSVKKDLKGLQHKLFNNTGKVTVLDQVRILQSARDYIKHLEKHLQDHLGEIPSQDDTGDG